MAILSNTSADYVSANELHYKSLIPQTNKLCEHTFRIRYSTSGTLTTSEKILLEASFTVVSSRVTSLLGNSEVTLNSTIATTIWDFLSSSCQLPNGKYFPATGTVLESSKMYACPIIRGQLATSNYITNYLFYFYYMLSSSALQSCNLGTLVTSGKYKVLETIRTI